MSFLDSSLFLQLSKDLRLWFTFKVHEKWIEIQRKRQILMKFSKDQASLTGISIHPFTFVSE